MCVCSHEHDDEEDHHHRAHSHSHGHGGKVAGDTTMAFYKIGAMLSIVAVGHMLARMHVYAHAARMPRLLACTCRTHAPRRR